MQMVFRVPYYRIEIFITYRSDKVCYWYKVQQLNSILIGQSRANNGPSPLLYTFQFFFFFNALALCVEKDRWRVQGWQLSRIFWESPDFEPYLLVSRFMSVISRFWDVSSGLQIYVCNLPDNWRSLPFGVCSTLLHAICWGSHVLYIWRRVRLTALRVR